VKQLPTGKVIQGDHKLLELTDGTIQEGRNYKFQDKIGKVEYIAMIWDGTDNLRFMVRLEDKLGEEWVFEYDAL
jgi:hypothetical protein